MKKITQILGLSLVSASVLLCSGCLTDHKEEKKVAAKVDTTSIYHRLGGQAAIDAAVELFYVKVLADKSVNHFFEDVNMNKQRKKQKAFLAAAFGGPVPYVGKDLRKAHASLDLKESDFNAIAGHLQATLKELKINDKLIAEVMAVAASTKDAVLNRKPSK
jgi:hemoglobin